MRKPTILGAKSYLAEILIKHFHNKTHQGTEYTLNQLRQKYWILRGRTAVKKAVGQQEGGGGSRRAVVFTAVKNIVKSCVLCRRTKGKTMMAKMGQSPKYRLKKLSRPLEFCGLDYFGPIQVTIGRRREKHYGALFTCMATRAVHLEL